MNIYDRIRLLGDRIRAIAHKDPSDEDNSQNSQEEAPPILRAELQIPQSVIERYDAQQSDEAKSKKRRERFEVITLVTGVIGLIALLATMCETRRATNAVIESAHADKRAWVSLGEIQVLDKPISGTRLGIKVGVRNSGESPAVHAFVNGRLSLWRGASLPTRVPFLESKDLAMCVTPKPYWDDTLGGVTIVPGSNATNIYDPGPVLSENILKMIMSKEIVELTKEDLDPIPADPTAPPDTYPWYVGLLFVGCVNYFDAFHEAHRTSFCHYYKYNPALEASHPNGFFVTCDKGNDAD